MPKDESFHGGIGNDQSARSNCDRTEHQGSSAGRAGFHEKNLCLSRTVRTGHSHVLRSLSKVFRSVIVHGMWALESANV